MVEVSLNYDNDRITVLSPPCHLVLFIRLLLIIMALSRPGLCPLN